MKQLVFFPIAFFVSFSMSAYGQSPQLNAVIKVVGISRVCPDPCPGGTDEVNVLMEAYLYVNGQLSPVQPNYIYAWEKRDAACNGSWGFHDTHTGSNESYTHTYQDPTRCTGGLFEVRVTISGYGGNPSTSVTSSVTTIPWHKNTLDQKRNDATTYGTVKYYDGTSFVNSGTLPSTLYSPRNEYIVLLGDINLTPDRTEKYHHWTDGQTTQWQNYNLFFPPSVFNSYTAQFQPTFPATIQAQLDRRTKLWLKG